MDQVFLSRLQFAFTASYHFIFVPITIGIGLITAIFVTMAYRSKKPEDDALAYLWVKIYTATFAIGVATGITMEFSFGTNWANYSRFVGDIFGAPLAAEALFAFFLESIFLGFLLFGRGKIKPVLYVVSAWLTFIGSALSALWILIANSWQQTPAGAELSPDGSEALITDFFAAAFNASTGVRYAHTVLSLLVMGAFVAIAVAAWYMHKKDKSLLESARKMMKVGVIVAIISTCCLLVSAHATASEVWEEQPTKMAMMEGLYEADVPGYAIIGYVDETAQELNALEIPGFTSFLATGTFDTAYPGLNDLAETDQFSDVVVTDLDVNVVFQSYHIMVTVFGILCVVIILALIFMRKKAKHNISNMPWLQWLLIISPIFPCIAIQCGWYTAEIGRQPYVVYPATSSPEGIQLLTADGTSVSVQPFELIITLALFLAVYVLLFVGWARVIARFIKQGPKPQAVSANGATMTATVDGDDGAAGVPGAAGSSDTDAAESASGTTARSANSDIEEGRISFRGMVTDQDAEDYDLDATTEAFEIDMPSDDEEGEAR